LGEDLKLKRLKLGDPSPPRHTNGVDKGEALASLQTQDIEQVVSYIVANAHALTSPQAVIHTNPRHGPTAKRNLTHSPR
tara:strand:- start:7 stop:243 length:237 start_codon:yes stop_codon:yes gene_type:complete